MSALTLALRDISISAQHQVFILSFQEPQWARQSNCGQPRFWCQSI